MQAKGELINDILVLAIFIYLILLVNGKIKMRPDKQEKMDGLVKRGGRLLKVLVYGGALIFMTVFLMQVFVRA